MVKNFSSGDVITTVFFPPVEPAKLYFSTLAKNLVKNCENLVENLGKNLPKNLGTGGGFPPSPV